MELAELTSPSAGDRPSYVNYTTWIVKERTLLDHKDKLEGDVNMLTQTLSYLALSTSCPATDPAMQAVRKVINEKKREISKTVSQE